MLQSQNDRPLATLSNLGSVEAFEMLQEICAKSGILGGVVESSTMQLQSDWKTIRWTRVALMSIPIAIFLAAPLWHHLVNPTAYAEVRCVIQNLDGSVTKGVGRSECLDNGKQTLILRVKQNQGQIDPTL